MTITVRRDDTILRIVIQNVPGGLPRGIVELAAKGMRTRTLTGSGS